MGTLITESNKEVIAGDERTIGAEIRALRQARGLSLRALARKSQVSLAALSYWETGRSVPSIPELDAALSALGATESDQRALLRLLPKPRAAPRLRALEGAAAPPVRGDLLWSLRQRQGWTQAHVARSVGVTQAQIARWETSDAWPDNEKLQMLCWHLGAHPDEVAALVGGADKGGARGAFLPGSDAFPQESASGDADNIHAWMTYFHRLLYQGNASCALFVLTLFGAEARLSELAVRNDWARFLLPNAYAIHARHYQEQQQYRSAAVFASRGLALARSHRLNDGTAFGSALWFGNVIALAHALGEKKGPTGSKQAAALLRDWLPAASHCDAHSAWGRGTLARYLGASGRVDEAVNVGEEACRQGERAKPVEYHLRLRDQAQVLLAVGRPADALATLEKCDALTREDNATLNARDTLARRQLIAAECLTALHDPQAADEALRSAERLIRAAGLFHLDASLQRVIKKF